MSKIEFDINEFFIKEKNGYYAPVRLPVKEVQIISDINKSDEMFDKMINNYQNMPSSFTINDVKLPFRTRLYFKLMFLKLKIKQIFGRK